jgi:hypothetical protein
MEGQRHREHQLKVDCTAFHSPKSRQSVEFFNVIYNINIPADVVHNPEQRQNALERTRNLLRQDFNGGVSVFYQITGTYVLIHSESGQTMEWVGSFQEELHNPSLVQDFELFDPATFVDTVFPLLNNVEEKLTWNGRDTKWKFDRLQSIIINSQSIVLSTHSVLRIRNLKRKKRKFRNTFDLP